MTDRIELRGIRATGYHGVLPAERRDGQPFVVDVVLEVDTAAAARSDSLADTVDYAAVSADVAAVVAGDAMDLVETLAQRIADVCLRDSRVTAVHVTVHKPQAPVAVTVDDIAVAISRRRS